MAEDDMDAEFERFLQESLSASTTTTVNSTNRQSRPPIIESASKMPASVDIIVGGSILPSNSDKLWWLKKDDAGSADDGQSKKMSFLKKTQPPLERKPQVGGTIEPEPEVQLEQEKILPLKTPLNMKNVGAVEESSESTKSERTLTSMDSEFKVQHSTSGDGVHMNNVTSTGDDNTGTAFEVDHEETINEYGDEDFETDLDVTIAGQTSEATSDTNTSRVALIDSQPGPAAHSDLSSDSIPDKRHLSTQEADVAVESSSELHLDIQKDMFERLALSQLTISEHETSSSLRDILQTHSNLKQNGPNTIRSIDEILQDVAELERITVSRESSNDEHPLINRRIDSDSRHDLRDSSGSRLDLVNLQELLRKERRRNSKLKAELENRERSVRTELNQQKLKYEERLADLQNNIVQSSAKLKALQSQKIETNTKESIEQERLLKGYETENKRMYDQVKSLEAALKQSRAEVASKNQRPLTGFIKDNYMMEAASNYSPQPLQKPENNSPKPPPRHIQDDLQDGPRRGTSDEERQPSKEGIELLAMDNEVTSLKKRVVALEKEVRQKNLENDSATRVIAAKDRAIDQSRKRMKQLENLLQVKNPNSISALVLASGVSTMAVGQSGTEETSTRVVHLLEERIRDLERQLEAKDGGESLIALQRQFDNVKVRYEAKIEQLEQRLKQAASSTMTAATRRPQTSVTALEKELSNIRERHRAEVNALRKELETKRINNSTKDNDRLSSLIAKNRALIEQIDAKDRTIRDLESRLLAASKTTTASRPTSSSQDADKKVSLLSNELATLRSELKSNKAQLERAETDLREANEKLEDSNTSRRTEMTTMDAQLQQVTKRCLELRRKSETQEVIVENLREQLSKAIVKQETVNSVSLENVTLKRRCQELQEDVCRLETQRSPEQRDFLSLQARVLLAEKLYEEKCETLKRFVFERHHAHSDRADVNFEVDKWKCKFYARNAELERVRSELDAILLTLEELQEQAATTGSSNRASTTVGVRARPYRKAT